jgi:F0F1-type ATP synthase membrane subunit c/vacuolar-type H+-ATPase subunit K
VTGVLTCALPFLFVGVWVFDISGALLIPSAAAGQTATMFIGIAFAEALGIFSFLVALLLMFAV